MHILICSIGDQRYGFDLAVVERSILALEITPIPNSPSHILGAINIHGQIMPVLSLRQLLGLPHKTLSIDDHFVVCRDRHKPIALWVDRVIQVKHCRQEDLIPAQDVMPDCDTVRYALKEDGKITLIFDLEKLIGSRGPVLHS